MTDRELLEFAAKAAGYNVRWHESWQCFAHTEPHNITTPPTLAGQRYVWVPLEDDGDALRLAVKLLIQVVQDRMGFVKVGWSVGFDSGTPSTDGRGPWYWKEWLSDHNGDRQAATRRAITQAAAAIGKAMP